MTQRQSTREHFHGVLERDQALLSSLLESSPEAVSARGSIPSGDETILIVDDEMMVLKALRRILSSLGYRILTALNGREAVEIVQNFDDRIDLALLDLGMPVMSGVEAFPVLREERPEMRILICSGFELDSASQRLIESGACGFVQKPFEIQTLARDIRSVLDEQLGSGG